VRLVREGGRQISAAAKDLGVSAESLRHWVKHGHSNQTSWTWRRSRIQPHVRPPRPLPSAAPIDSSDAASIPHLVGVSQSGKRLILTPGIWFSIWALGQTAAGNPSGRRPMFALHPASCITIGQSTRSVQIRICCRIVSLVALLYRRPTKAAPRYRIASVSLRAVRWSRLPPQRSERPRRDPTARALRLARCTPR
jgi:hypothetical protein